MSQSNLSGARNDPDSFEDQIARKVTQKASSSKDFHKEVVFGIGAMGMVGWSVAIPTIVGALAGAWIDDHKWSDRSWTLALLIAGLCLGCFNAWYWVDLETRAIAERGGPHP